MPSMFQFKYRFHPVGQGIFASGTVADIDSPIPFHWVFDCGSVSRATTLTPIVRRYRDLVLDGYLDLLCISHFDNDHVNGLGDLLPGLHVGTVVLPYCSNLERLIVGARNPSNEAGYLQFLGNPVAFLLERAASIQQIIIVGGPSGDQPPLDLPDRPPNIDGPAEPPPRPEGWIFKVLEGPQDASERVCDAKTLAAAQTRRTAICHAPSSFQGFAVPTTRAANWEFLFFHKPINPVSIEAIKQQVARVLQSLKQTNPDIDVTGILSDESVQKRIKSAYVAGLKAAGRIGESINTTSLCVYSGPELDRLTGSEVLPPWPGTLVGAPSGNQCHFNFFPDHCSVLYTGDANLKLPENRAELLEFLSQPRWDHVCVLQIPHHGSRENWQVGSADEFAHLYSVFCADETHKGYKHPSREVVLDLIHRGPVIANKHIGWSWHGRAYFR